MSQHDYLPKLARVAVLCASTCAIQCHAALFDIHFSGTLGSYQRAPELGYPNSGLNQIVSGSIRIDSGLAGGDQLPTNANKDLYAPGVNWVRTSFDRPIPYSYEDPTAPGQHYDWVQFDRYRDYDQITVGDHFSDHKRSYCGGIVRPSDYCWQIKLTARVEKNTFEFDNDLRLDDANVLWSSITMRLVNYDPQRGLVTGNAYLPFQLSSLTLTPVAPVPLPATALMFLVALGSFAGWKTSRGSQTSQTTVNAGTK